MPVTTSSLWPRVRRAVLTVSVGAAAAVLLATPANGAPLVRSAAGSAAADVQAALDGFRADLGGALNPNQPGSVGSGRREINWDGVPEGVSSPNAFPADFFNANTPGRARGAVFSTPGTGFEVSANAGAGVQFGNIDASYPGEFEPFTAQKLFTPVGSNILDVSFFVPGSTTAALTRGFGAVFSDVDAPNTTSLEFFDSVGGSLGLYYVPALAGSETFSFLGVSFDNPVVSCVRIVNGNAALGAGVTDQNGNPRDLVVMDDFVYGEPIAAVPEPATLTLLGLGLAAAALRKRAR